MPFFFVYILKVSVSLAVVYLFYHLVLRKLTFYNWNRWYLYGYTLFSFLIPFLDISPVLEKNKWTGRNIVEWVPIIHNAATGEGTQINSPASSAMWNLVILTMFLGMMILLTRFFVQFISFSRMKRRAQLIEGNGMNIYQVDDTIIPFSFGNSIFINRNLHSEPELQEIIRHEFVHVKQRHSMDIIWTEILCLLNWYNPFAWLLKKAIRQNLEFIADDKVLQNGINKKEYQYLLLKVIGNNQYSIATQFNFSSLKKRIAMMNKIKSARKHLFKFFFLVPVIAVMLLAFRNRNERGVGSSNRMDGNLVQDTVPGKKHSAKLPEEISSIGLLQSKDEDVSSDPIKQKLHGLVAVKRKDGQKEVYDLDSKENRDAFEKKYGVKLEDLLPPPPPPPPPLPPPAKLPDNVEKMDVNNKKATVWLKNGQKENYDFTVPSQKEVFEKKYGDVLPPPPPPPPKPCTEEGLSRISDDYEITNESAVITLKDGTTEKFDLTKPKERKKFEEKYGQLIELPVKVNSTVNVNINSEVTAPTTVIGAGVGIGHGKASTPSLNPVTAIHTIGAPYGTSATVINGDIPSKAIGAPSTLSHAVNGTTVVAPMNPAITGEPVTIIGESDPFIKGTEEVLLTIINRTTRQQLDAYKKQVLEKGVELDYTDIEYNDKGELIYLSGTLDSKDGRSNFVASDFNKLVLAMIKNGEKTYFRVSVKNNKTVI